MGGKKTWPELQLTLSRKQVGCSDHRTMWSTGKSFVSICLIIQLIVRLQQADAQQESQDDVYRQRITQPQHHQQQETEEGLQDEYDGNQTQPQQQQPPQTTTPTTVDATDNRTVVRIGFLPALTANKGQSKHFVGAFIYALNNMNEHVLKNSKYKLDYQVYDNKADSAESLRGMTALYNNGCIAFVGPEGSCTTEAKLATAWNIPMFAFKCRESTVSNKDGHYPTFVRTIPSTSKVSKSLISLMKHFKWTVFQAIVGNSAIWIEAAQTLRQLAEANNIKMNPDKTYTESYIWTEENLMPALVEQTHQQTRIYVFLGDHHALIDFVRYMRDHNLNNGEYLVIAVEEAPYDPTQRFRYFHKYLELLEEDMVDAFTSVLMLLPSTPSNPKYSEFIDASRSFSYLAPFFAPTPPYPEMELPVPIFAAYLYDAVSLYARALKEAGEEGIDPRNGSAIVARITKRNYESIQGHWMFIDANGNAEANYTLLALLPEPNPVDGIHKRSLQQVGHFITYAVKIPRFNLVTDIQWAGGSAPVSEPECGFDGSKCQNETTTMTYWPIAIVSIISSSIIAIAIVFVCRHYLYEQKLAGLMWKIDYRDLFMPEHDSDPAFSEKVLRRPFGLLSTHSMESGDPYPVNRFKIVQYKNQKVAIKIIRRRHIEINRAVKKELYLMKELAHDNLNRFIGACVEPPYICIVMQYCARGSLKDIIENYDIHLDDMFIASLVFDLIKGMIYLHDSVLVSHGCLRPSNCLVDSRWVLQISDYGLHNFKARENIPTQVDDARVLTKLLWQAPELLRDPCTPSRGSQKGDVYSFALILFKIHSRSGPWNHDVYSQKETLEMLKNPINGRIIRPDPTQLPCQECAIRCMQDCWQEDDQSRPDFKTIRNILKPMQQGLSPNIFDNMLAIMEKYATRLESLVQQRTSQLAEEKRKLAEEKKKTEILLLSMLPKSVAEQLIRGENVAPEQYECVTIYFSDIVGFTTLSAESTPMQMVDMLNELYTIFDSIIGNYDVYKVETIGDAYMVVSGLPIRNKDCHAGEIASMSLHLLRAISGFRIKHRPAQKLQLRIGIHSGPVVAGVVGSKMPRYCLFGDTVNTASRVESTGEAMKIHCSLDCKLILDKLGGYHLTARGLTSLRGRGEMYTYFVAGEDSSERLRRISQNASFSNGSGHDLNMDRTLSFSSVSRQNLNTCGSSSAPECSEEDTIRISIEKAESDPTMSSQRSLTESAIGTGSTKSASERSVSSRYSWNKEDYNDECDRDMMMTRNYFVNNNNHINNQTTTDVELGQTVPLLIGHDYADCIRERVN